MTRTVHSLVPLWSDTRVLTPPKASPPTVSTPAAHLQRVEGQSSTDNPKALGQDLDSLQWSRCLKAARRDATISTGPIQLVASDTCSELAGGRVQRGLAGALARWVVHIEKTPRTVRVGGKKNRSYDE